MGDIRIFFDEELRLNELSHYNVLMEEKEEIFYDLAKIAMLMTSAPLAGVSLVDKKNVWLKGRVGVDLACLEREGAFCSYAVESNQDIFAVSDAQLDPRFKKNPLVTSAPHIRFYAAANLVGQRGYRLGTLWIMDAQPRELTQPQCDAMLALAAQVVRILEMRYHNPKTMLPNRGAFVSNLQCALNQQQSSQACRLAGCARRIQNGGCLSEGRKEPCAVGFIHLHNLHLINSAYGSKTGDELLVRLTHELREWMGKNNLLAHLEGDDIAFALFQSGPPIDQLLKQLPDLLSRPVKVDDALLHLAATVGISRFPDSGLNASSLLDQAAAASSHPYEISPTKLLSFYDQSSSDAFQVIEFQKNLPNDIRQKRLLPYYQPQVNAVTGRVVGFEALARLRHPKHGLVGPDRFIRAAEQSGLIYEVDMQILHAVCNDIRFWQQEKLSVVPIAINLSRTSLMHPKLLQALQETLQEYDISPSLIEVEVTESGLAEHPEVIGQRVADIRAMGFKVSIDDFGTGLSNLGTLRNIRFDRLKADRQYVHGASVNIYVGGILHFIRGIGEVFEVETLCEGIEEQEDLDWILAMNCHLFQGWYFSKALAPEHIPEVLRRLDNYYASGQWAAEGPRSLASCLQA